MSDRALWLEEWCPTCRAGAWGALPCSVLPARRGRPRAPRRAGVARAAVPDVQGARQASRAAPRRVARRRARMRRGCGPDGRADLSDGGVAGARAPGRDDRHRPVQRPRRTRRPDRQDRAESPRRRRAGHVERWTSRDELCYALEAPVWDRFGSFAGQPPIAGTVVWTSADRRVVIEGRRGDSASRSSCDRPGGQSHHVASAASIRARPTSRFRRRERPGCHPVFRT